MLFRTHFVFGLFIFLLIYPFFENLFLFSLFFLFSIFFVDVDSKKSRMGKIIIFRPLQLVFSHRGMFHSIFFALALVCFLILFDLSAGFGFLIGYLSHLFLDCFSVSGVRLFWPISAKKVRGFVKTGGIIEEILFVFLLLFDVYFVGRIVWYSVFSII